MTLYAVLQRLALICLLLPAVAGAAENAAPLGQPGEGELAALLGAIVKVSGALAVVVGLMFVVLFFVKKLDLGRGRFVRGSLIEVLDTKMIAPRKYISVVNVGGELLAVGVSEQQISMLTRLDPTVRTLAAGAAGQEPASAAPAGAFAALLARAGMTVGMGRASDAGVAGKEGDGHA